MQPDRIDEITILPGRTSNGVREPFRRIVIRPGDILSIVGSTGSGKTALINDIEVFACEDTITGRTILVNGELPPESFVRDPAKKPFALITQNTKCLADLTVAEFLAMHIRARKIKDTDIIGRTVELANEFTGEGIKPEMRMTSLSGGQTRSLLIADAIVVSNAPIILLDEVESGGIFKEKVIALLKKHRKAVLFVTHDPLLSLLADRRIVMKNGGVARVLTPNGKEKGALQELGRMDAMLCTLRERIRAGEVISEERAAA
jgi:ABC-type lipoprotein export system ATPase subunit